MGTRSGRRIVSVVAFAGLVGLGATATVLAFRVQHDTKQRQDEQVVDRAAAQLSLRLRAGLAALRGAGAVAQDGSVSDAEFSAFATEALRDSIFSALAYSDLLAGSDRVGWEQQTGYRIQDTDGAGGFRPPTQRDRYMPVRVVVPLDEMTRPVLGFDILSDPVRATGSEKAFQGRDPVLVGPINLVRSGGLGLYAIFAVRDPQGAPVGLVSTGIGIPGLLTGLSDIAGLDPTRVTVRIDGNVVIDGRQSGPAREFATGGRLLSITARSQTPTPGRFVPWTVLGGTLALTAAALMLAQLSRNDSTRERLEHERQSRMVVLMEELAEASDPQALARIAAERARDVLGSDHTNVGVRDPTDATKLVVVHDGSMAPPLSDRYRLQALAERLPLTDCVRENRPIMIADRAAYVDMYPHLVEPLRAAGIRAVLCVPISAAAGGVAGVLGFAWKRDLAIRNFTSLARAATQLAEVVGRALERAVGQEAVAAGMDRLREFTAELTAAARVADVETAVDDHLAALFGVAAVTLRTEPASDGGPRQRWYPLAGDHGRQLGLVVETLTVDQWTPAHENLMQTVTQLVHQSWQRTRDHEQDRAVLERLQASLLSPPPALPHLAVDVRYVAALDSVGLGGDWYSVIDRPDSTLLVIGDVAGHGPEAVALMAEVKSVLRHVLTAGATLEQAATEADTVLGRRKGYASAIIVELPHHTPTLRYLNAGHPFPLLRTQHGVHVLSDVHRPWLGLATPSAEITERPFGPRDALLLYTDGLVERRDRPIDDGIDHLRLVMTQTADESLLDTLIQTQRQIGHDYVDDDIALVLAVRLPSGAPLMR